MTKLSEIPSDFYLEYYRELPQIAEKDVSLLWHDGYYDGPLNGILLYAEKIHWFQIFYPLRTDERRDRVDEEGISWNDYFVRYLVIQLSEEQIKEEKYWHELLQQRIGTNTDYDKDGRRIQSELKPKEMQDEYYELAKTRNPRDLSNNLIVGWFETLWGSIRQDEDNNDDI
jgi:hypothetical protein